MKGMRYMGVWMCMLLATSLEAQTEIFLGPGIGTNRNKKTVETETGPYSLMAFNQDYKIDLGLFLHPHVYLNASYAVYRQQIRPVPYSTTAVPVYGEAYSTYTQTHYHSLAHYHYQGVSLIPGFFTGDKIRFFAGAGLNWDFSKIDQTDLTATQDYYLADSSGRYTYQYSSVSDTSTLVSARKGSDLSGIVQSGVSFRLGKALLLQLSAYYRHSFVLRSLEGANDYKSNAGISVSILYRLWTNMRTTPEVPPVE